MFNEHLLLWLINIDEYSQIQLNIREEDEWMLASSSSSSFVDFRLMANRSVWIKMIYLLVSWDNFYLMINWLFVFVSLALMLSRNQCRKNVKNFLNGSLRLYVYSEVWLFLFYTGIILTILVSYADIYIYSTSE